MTDIMKLVKLDFYTVKYYLKSFLIVLILPFCFIASSLSASLTAAIAILSYRLSCLVFDVTDKTGMGRLPSLLPVSKKKQVAGRYLFTAVGGFITILFFLLIDMVLYRFMHRSVTSEEIFCAVVISTALLFLFTAFQLPVLYKMGAIKGRTMTVIPIVIFAGLILLLDSRGILDGLNSMNPYALAILFLAVSFVLFILSMLVSVRFLVKKEQ